MAVLARYIASARTKPLPGTVVESAKHHVLDTIAAMVSGSELRAGAAAITYARNVGGARDAMVVATRILIDPVNAALANGMLAHADETDDSHGPSATHPGCSIVAASLALGEYGGCGGMAFLRAVVLGYDVSCRLSSALGADAFRKVGHSTHGFGPTFGAAAAGASLLRMSADEVRYVLAYAAQQASGIASYPRDHEHIEKAFDFGGLPARNGVAAATMVSTGCTGVSNVFAGERNFFFAFDESRRIGKAPCTKSLLADLGRIFEITRTNIKRWSVASPIQAPLDSLLILMRDNDVYANDVERVVVRISIAGARITNNREMSDLNMQHICALMLVDGHVTFAMAHNNERMRDPKILKMRKRIQVVADESLEKLRPERHAIVELELKDGRRLCHHTSAVRGTIANPMNRLEVEGKCYELMAPVLGAKRARALCDAIWRIENIKDMRQLRPLLQMR